MATYKKILVMRLSALGDVAMTIPQIYSACRAYPGVTFVVLTQRLSAQLFMHAPANLQVYVAEVRARHKGIAGMVLLSRELKALGIDAVADLHDVLRTRLLRFLLQRAGIPTFVIDKGRPEKKQLTRHSDKTLTPLTPMGERYAQVFAAMGMPYEWDFTSIFPAKGDPGMFTHIAPPKAAGQRWVGVAPFAKHEGKIYPVEKMERVVELLGRSGVHTFLFGSAAEAHLLAKWQQRYPRVVSLASRQQGFAVEMALMSHLDVMLTMDSANMHLAALVGVPVVSVWGATHPYAGFLGYTAREDYVVQCDLPCRPCSVFGDKPCRRGDYACLRNIHPEAVAQRVLVVAGVGNNGQ